MSAPRARSSSHWRRRAARSWTGVCSVSSTTTRCRSGRVARASCTGAEPSRCGLTLTVEERVRRAARGRRRAPCGWPAPRARRPRRPRPRRRTRRRVRRCPGSGPAPRSRRPWRPRGRRSAGRPASGRRGRRAADGSPAARRPRAEHGVSIGPHAAVLEPACVTSPGWRTVRVSDRALPASVLSSSGRSAARSRGRGRGTCVDVACARP